MHRYSRKYRQRARWKSILRRVISGVMLIAPWSIFRVGTIVAGGVAGWLLCGSEAHDGFLMPVSRRFGIFCFVVFFALLVLAFVPVPTGPLALFDAFYRSGALVLGGGHVVLPLLRNGRCGAGLGFGRHVPDGIWRGAGRARPAIHFRSRSRRGCRDTARRGRGGGDRAARDICAGHSLSAGHLTILA